MMKLPHTRAASPLTASWRPHDFIEANGACLSPETTVAMDQSDRGTMPHRLDAPIDAPLSCLLVWLTPILQTG